MSKPLSKRETSGVRQQNGNPKELSDKMFSCISRDEPLFDANSDEDQKEAQYNFIPLCASYICQVYFASFLVNYLDVKWPKVVRSIHVIFCIDWSTFLRDTFRLMVHNFFDFCSLNNHAKALDRTYHSDNFRFNCRTILFTQ